MCCTAKPASGQHLRQAAQYVHSPDRCDRKHVHDRRAAGEVGDERETGAGTPAGGSFSCSVSASATSVCRSACCTIACSRSTARADAVRSGWSACSRHTNSVQVITVRGYCSDGDGSIPFVSTLSERCTPAKSGVIVSLLLPQGKRLTSSKGSVNKRGHKTFNSTCAAPEAGPPSMTVVAAPLVVRTWQRTWHRSAPLQQVRGRPVAGHDAADAARAQLQHQHGSRSLAQVAAHGRVCPSKSVGDAMWCNVAVPVTCQRANVGCS